MAAINEVEFGPGTELFRAIFAEKLWAWILANGDRKFTLKIWFIRKTFKVSDLHEVFALLLGPKPAGT
jgi:hypothetical protein